MPEKPSIPLFRRQPDLISQYDLGIFLRWGASSGLFGLFEGPGAHTWGNMEKHNQRMTADSEE